MLGGLAERASRGNQPPGFAAWTCTLCWLMSMRIYHGSMRVGRWSLAALMSCSELAHQGKSKGKKKEKGKGTADDWTIIFGFDFEWSCLCRVALNNEIQHFRMSKGASRLAEELASI